MDFFVVSFFLFVCFLSRVNGALLQSRNKIGIHSNSTVKLYSFMCLILSINDLKRFMYNLKGKSSVGSVTGGPDRTQRRATGTTSKFLLEGNFQMLPQTE